jgi:hypothetical protein
VEEGVGMERLVLKFTPEIRDYYKTAASYVTRKHPYWIILGIYSVCIVVILLLTVLVTFDSGLGALKSAIIFFWPIVLFFIFVAFIPYFSGWLTVRSATVREQLTIPASYEIDEEKVVIANAVADVRYSWNAFSHAFENNAYFFLTSSSSKNMFHFIPKRAFLTLEDEVFFRSLLFRKIGKVENIQSGLRGWKLLLLTAVLFALLLMCIGVVTLVYGYFVDGTLPSSFVA